MEATCSKTHMEYGSLRSAERGTRNNIVDLSQTKYQPPNTKHRARSRRRRG
jgi:hypothetical protein